MKGWRRRLKRIPRWIEVSAATVGLILGLAVVGKFLVGSGENLLAEGSGGEIEVRQVVVVNRRMDVDLVNGGFLQTRGSTPQLDITVRNTGKKPTLLTGVTIEVVDSGRLAVCDYHTGDAVAASRKYAVELPVLPLRSENVVTHPLHQEIDAGDVDRFKVLFRVPGSGEANYVYALSVALVAENSDKAVDVGRFILGVPEAVNRGGRILPEGPRPFGVLNDGERLMSTWCARRNLSVLRRLLRQPGKRSSSMGALSEFQPADWWREFADRRPPQAAVEPLFHESFGEGPILAVFAAERSGDRDLEKKTRRRAAAVLIHDADHALALGYPWAAWGAVMDARYAMRFWPSAEAKRMRLRAESRWEVAQTEIPSGGAD
jgi:hypothetical protein